MSEGKNNPLLSNIDGNRESHFSPLVDSRRIYGALFRFLRK